MKHRWEQRLSHILATKSTQELLEVWAKVTSKGKMVGPTLEEYLGHLDVLTARACSLEDPPKFKFRNNISDPHIFGGLFFFLI
jgi:hypothetical protein